MDHTLNKMNLLRTSSILAAFVLLPIMASAAGAGITYHGRLVDKDGRAVESSNVQFRLQIRTPGNENCLMYEEVQVKDLSQTSGAFAVTVNDGTGTRLDTSGYGLDQIFANRNSYVFAGGICASGTTYSPNASDSRRIQVLFNDGTFPVGQWEPVPPMAVNFVPMAIESMQVGGYKKEQLIKIADGVATTGTELNSASWTELLALIAGTSTRFVKPGTANFTAAPTWAGAPTAANELANKAYVDAQVAAGLPAVGTAGTYTKVTTDAQGRVTSGTTLAEADLPNITTAGKVSGGAINAGTIGGSTAINTSGNLYTSGTVTGLTVAATNLRVYNGTDYVQFTAPALGGANVLFTLPAADGTSGQVLKTNGAGVLSWISPSSGSVTGAGTTNYVPIFTAASALGDSPIAVSGANVGVGTASPNTALDVNGALSQRGMAAPAVSVAGQGRIYFDSTSNTFKMSKNAGGYGDIAFGNCALNEVLKWNGTTWACAADATGTAPVDASYAAKGIVQFLTDAATSGITVAAGVANVNMGTGANQIVQLTAAAKYPAVDGSLITNIAATSLAGVLPIANGGTNSSTALNNGRLMASVGGAIVETAAMTDGQIVVGKTGSAPQLVTMSGDATVSNLGAVTLATVPVTKGGTATTSYGNNKVIVSNGTGSALVAASCALNQVISFDAGGSLTCANVSDLSTAYQNGGNSFGANATLGTNDNYTLAFKTNNAVVMTILANGNVGIGATNPGSSLEINRAVSSIKSSDVATGAGNTLNILGSASGDNNGGNINITAGGTSGSTGATSGGSVTITSGSIAGGTNANSTGNVTVKAANGAGGSSSAGGSLTLAAGNSVATGSAKTAGSVAITAGNSGSNLNAGSNTPGGGVSIAAGSGNSNINATAGSAGDGGPISITSGNGGGGGDVADGGNITMQTGAAGGAGLAGAILFKIGGNFEKMRIHTNGNVGIGTAAPTAKLHVSGGSIVAAPGSGSAQCTDFSTGNIQVSSYVATNTIKIGGLVDGGAYTLVLTGYTGGQTITVLGYTDATCTAAVTTGVDFGGSAGAVTPTLVAAGNTQLVTFIYSAARGVVYASAGTNFYY